MQLLVYGLAYPFLWLVSRLPFTLLYLISDGMYIFIYHMVGYRKKVVRDNLRLVFPEKGQEELIHIEKKFYRHMCDMFLEMIKTMGITAKEVAQRYVFTNLEVYHELEKKGKNTILMLPHYASWEWIFGLNAQNSSKGYGIYLRIQNKYFDRLVRDIRSKFGTTLIVTSESRKIIKEANASGELFTVGIISDQSPMVSRARHWDTFMGITVPVHIGGEELAKKHNLTPLFVKVKKIKRGYYQAHFIPLAENPADIPDYGITRMFLDETEKSIKEAPEYYFWTHKRWKHRHKVPPEFQS